MSFRYFPSQLSPTSHLPIASFHHGALHNLCGLSLWSPAFSCCLSRPLLILWFLALEFAHLSNWFLEPHPETFWKCSVVSDGLAKGILNTD